MVIKIHSIPFHFIWPINWDLKIWPICHTCPVGPHTEEVPRQAGLPGRAVRSILAFLGTATGILVGSRGTDPGISLRGAWPFSGARICT